MSEIKFITEQDETGLGRIVIDGRYFGLPAREVAIFAAANERIGALGAALDMAQKSLEWAAKVDDQLTAEREVSDKLEKWLTEAVGMNSKGNWDWWYGATAALAEVAAIRKGEKQ